MKKALRRSWETPLSEAVRKLRSAPCCRWAQSCAQHIARDQQCLLHFPASSEWNLLSLKPQILPPTDYSYLEGTKCLRSELTIPSSLLSQLFMPKPTLALTVELWVSFLPPSLPHYIVRCSRTETLSPLQGLAHSRDSLNSHLNNIPKLRKTFSDFSLSSM